MNNQLQVLTKRVKKNKFLIWLRTQAFASKNVHIGGKSMKMYPLRFGIIALALIIALVLILNFIVLPLSAPRAVDAIAFESGSDYTMATYQDDVLLSNAKGAVGLSGSGKVKWEITDQKSKPMTDTNGDYYLRTEPGSGNKTSVYRKDKLVHTLDSKHTVITAKVNKNGHAAVASEETGYKGMVTVYDRKGRPQYTWHSGEGYITDIELSSDGRYLIVAQLMSDGETAYTRILFMDIRRDETVAVMRRENALISNLTFLSNDTLIAVSDVDVTGYSKVGKERFSISLAGKDPTLFSISDKLMVFLCTDGRGNSILDIYRTNGKYRGSYTATGEIKCLSVHESVIVAGSRKNVLYISPRGKLKRTLNLPHDVKNLAIFDDERTVLAVGGNKAHMFRIR